MRPTLLCLAATRVQLIGNPLTMIVGTGIDIIEVERIQNRLEKDEERFCAMLFTEAEINYCKSGAHALARARCFAGRFAAKEAFFKAIGTGLRDGLNWKDVEILNDDLGKPELVLKGKALEKIQEEGIDGVHVSISHGRTAAAAVVILDTH